MLQIINLANYDGNLLDKSSAMCTCASPLKEDKFQYNNKLWISNNDDVVSEVFPISVKKKKKKKKKKKRKLLTHYLQLNL